MNNQLTPKNLKGHWFTLPSGALVEVCSVTMAPQAIASVRYVNDDGIMSSTFFELCVDWLFKFGKSQGFVPGKQLQK